MPKRMRRLQITEVSMVDAGANPGAHVLICKRNSTGQEDNVVFKLENLPEEFRKAVSDELSRLNGQLATVTGELATLKKNVPAEPTPVVEPPKVPEEIQKRLQEQLAEVIALRGKLEEKEEAEYIAKAKVDYSKVQDIEPVAKALYAVRKKDAKLAEQLETILKSAQAVADKSTVITRELGASGDTNSDDTYANVVVMAKKLQANDPKLTHSAAIAKVFADNPALYDACESERMKKLRSA